MEYILTLELSFISNNYVKFENCYKKHEVTKWISWNKGSDCSTVQYYQQTLP